MSGAYQPQTDSLAGRVCAFFTSQPEEALSVADIVKKFDAPSRNINALLSAAVAAGALNRDKVGDTWEYSAGPQLAGAAKPTANMPFPGPAKPRTAKRLPPLNVDALQVVKDVPLPVPLSAGARYDALFKKLAEPGDSTLVPLAYKGSLEKAWRTYVSKKAPNQKFSVNAESDGVNCRVFRVA